MQVWKRACGGAVVGVTAGVAVAGTVSAQAAGTSTDDGFDSSEVLAAGVFVLAAIIVIGIGLLFSHRYHERLLQSIDAAIRLGKVDTIATSNDSSLDATRTRGAPQIGVTGPTTVEVGQTAVYEAVGASDPNAVSWSIEGGDATPSVGQGASIGVAFSKTGSAVVTAAQEGSTSAPLSVDVIASTKVGGREGIVLPFVIKNWARFVVVIFGVGAIAALMALGVVSAEGGIGVLGVLLGVGGATANADSESKPTDKS